MYYLNRAKKPAFHSVVLAGVYDIKNLKHGIWTKEGISEAVKVLLQSKPPLFDSMAKQFSIYPDLRSMIEQILYQGRKIPFSPAEKSIDLGLMFGFLREENGYMAVANRIFEMYLLDLFIAEEAVASDMFFYGQDSKNQFITGKRLDMELVLAKFVEHFTDIYGDNDEKFIEAYGRKFFLLYLKPIINGTGNYYIESQTRDAKRTDVIVDYLDYFRLDTGYLLSFNFNKKKTVGIQKIQIGDKTVVETVV